MCLIIDTQDARAIELDFFDEVTRVNNDGWGIAWHNRDGLQIRRGVNTVYLKNLYRVLDGAGVTNMLIHMRMATHGETSTAMCHPFDCGHGIYLAHNGITQYPPGGNALDELHKSDTALFVERFIAPLLDKVNNPTEFIRSREFEYVMTEVAGTYNKFAFVDKHGITIINRNLWTTGTNGMLLSNTSYAQMYSPPVMGGVYGHHWENSGWE